ncbi:hypothetical protein PENTCL1PPCAC_4590 [Pristionchus entomophagus]|uniref:Uncharacterized protein n=1 Tax=Pristionchus entomophagus TaxID=358040 RepID=A0AAV5SHQ8_9BILA|nr:hypothetical protein PENTCL1PPCAC_4590 [Pristionchus entomophagus]
MNLFSFNYLLSLLLLPSSLATDTCYSCASPELEEHWEVTSFPLKPKDLVFTEDCSSSKNVQLKKPCNSGVCYEGIIPLNNKATYVRGCYSDFLNQATSYTRANVSPTPICNYGMMGKQTFQDDMPLGLVGTAPTVFQAATRWCVNAGKTDGCNKELTYSAELFDNPNFYFRGCTNPGILPAKTCVDCSHSGGEGDCSANTPTTCRGTYCAKYEGNLNGDAMVVRECVPTSPLGEDCAWIESNTDFVLFGITLSLPYKANHCYCIGEMCNANSSRVPYSFLISLILPLLLSRILHFGYSA